MPGPTEWVIIGLVVVLLFGAKKLPEIARAVGRSSSEFKKGLKEGAGDEDAPPASGSRPGETPGSMTERTPDEAKE